METEEAKMKNRKKTLKIFLAVLIITALLATGAASAAESSKTFETLEDRIDYLQLMMDFIKGNYKYGVTDEELMNAAYNGLFDALDEHSDYFTADEYENFNLKANGEYGGVGVQITKRGEETVVIAPLEGTPGYRAGILSGDIVKTVDGQVITGYSLDKVVDLMRGDPGTSVELGILRQNRIEMISVEIIREKITIVEMDWEMLERGIGYIKIAKFSNDTSDNLENAIFELRQKDAQTLVIDLRNNPGGLVDEAIDALDLFIEKDRPILHIDYKEGSGRRSFYAKDDPMDIPVAVLVNSGSASASEIFAGAVKDTDSGTIIGEKTFGKGTVQSVIPITNGGAVKITTAEYLTASENKIDKVGIEPDITVSNPSDVDLAALMSFAPMIEADKPGYGDMGLNVYGAQQRLAFLGYDVPVTGKVGTKTFEAVKSFQKEEGIGVYGVLDWTTKDALNAKIDNILHRGAIDYQLERATELMREELE